MKLTSSFNIGNYEQPYIIAEIGSNHNGDMELAKRLILDAKAAGANCVKFQSWSKDTIFSRQKYDDNYFVADDYRERDDFTLEEIVDKYAISEVELLEMKSFADQIGIDCTSTPFSEGEADFLVEKLDSPFIKVASMDLTNVPFLRYLGSKGRPIIISTGLSDLADIDIAVRAIEEVGNAEICILHCVATYPPEDKDFHLNSIKTLRTCFPNYPIGFSDHSLGTVIPLTAVGLGAAVLEKHFTLDKNMEGWDHKVSATKDEMKVIVEGSKRIVSALGGFRVQATETDEKKTEFRRSLVLMRPHKKGEKIALSNLTSKRPGTGISPNLGTFIEGMRVNKDLPSDHVLTKSDII